MVSDPRVTTLLSRLGGLYRDPNRVDRDASSLLKSSVGIHLTPGISPLVENNGNSSHCLVLQGTIAIVFRGTTYQLLVDIYLSERYPIRPPVSYVRLAKNQVRWTLFSWSEKEQSRFCLSHSISQLCSLQQCAVFERKPPTRTQRWNGLPSLHPRMGSANAQPHRNGRGHEQRLLGAPSRIHPSGRSCPTTATSATTTRIFVLYFQHQFFFHQPTATNHQCC